MLHYCAKTAYVDCVEYLVRHNSDPNHSDYLGQTPLFFAARFNQTGMINLLAQLGAEVNVPLVEKKNFLGGGGWQAAGARFQSNFST